MCYKKNIEKYDKNVVVLNDFLRHFKHSFYINKKNINNN